MVGENDFTSGIFFLFFVDFSYDDPFILCKTRNICLTHTHTHKIAPIIPEHLKLKLHFLNEQNI